MNSFTQQNYCEVFHLTLDSQCLILEEKILLNFECNQALNSSILHLLMCCSRTKVEAARNRKAAFRSVYATKEATWTIRQLF